MKNFVKRITCSGVIRNVLYPKTGVVIQIEYEVYEGERFLLENIKLKSETEERLFRIAEYFRTFDPPTNYKKLIYRLNLESSFGKLECRDVVQCFFEDSVVSNFRFDFYLRRE